MYVMYSVVILLVCIVCDTFFVLSGSVLTFLARDATQVAVMLCREFSKPSVWGVYTPNFRTTPTAFLSR